MIGRLAEVFKGPAKDWYEYFIADGPKELAVVLQGLKDRFGYVDSKGFDRDRLIARKLRPREKLRDYVYSKLNLCTKYDKDMDDNEKISYIIGGLIHSKYHERVYDGYTSLQDLLAKLDRIQEGEEMRGEAEATDNDKDDKDQEQPNSSSNSKYNELSSRVDKVLSLSEQMFKLSINNRGRNGYPPRHQATPGASYNQGRPNYPNQQYNSPRWNNYQQRQLPAAGAGHQEQPYRDPIRTPGRTNFGEVTCYRCGVRGHFANSCTNPPLKVDIRQNAPNNQKN